MRHAMNDDMGRPGALMGMYPLSSSAVAQARRVLATLPRAALGMERERAVRSGGRPAKDDDG